jgi:succinate dehydrogenase / fumarate reductase, cytochrome b subunit
MSSAAPTKRQFSPNTPSSRKGIIDWLKPFLTTSVGMKATTALTGFLLTGFVTVHLIGNLNLLAGQDAINGYAHMLKGLGPGLWIARGGLLTIFLLHIYLALTLAIRSSRARPIGYHYPATIQASTASRTMPWTGLAILAFAVFHLAHYTFGWIGTTRAFDRATGTTVSANYLSLVDPQGRPDVYSMAVAGFRDPVISIVYIIAMLILFVHLSHGIGSVFQTLGLNTPRIQPAVTMFSRGLAVLIVAGNIGIVLAVWLRFVPEVDKFVGH